MSKHKPAPAGDPCPIGWTVRDELRCLPLRPGEAICSVCLGRIRDDLVELVKGDPVRPGEIIGGAGLLDQLELTRARMTVGGAGPGGGRSTEKPVPFDLRVEDVVREIAEALEWAALIVWSGSATYELGSGRPLDRAVYLLARLDRLQRSAAAVQVHGRIHAATRAGRQLIDSPPRRQYLGQCLSDVFEDGELAPSCQAHLWAVEGATTVECSECGAVHRVAELRDWLLDNVNMDQLATMHAIAAASEQLWQQQVTVDQVKWWVRSGRLRPFHGPEVGGGIPRRRYFVRDVALIVREDEHRAAVRERRKAEAAAAAATERITP